MAQVMTERNRCRVFIGLGGNLEDPLTRFREARQALGQHSRTEIVASSPLYQTAPVGGPAGQPDYLNAVLELTTGLALIELLDFCLELEQRAGRRRTVSWGARPLDLDLLFADDCVCVTSRLILPHPRLHLRRFVLQPLYDLAPELIHPVLGQGVARLLESLPDKAGVTQIQRVW